MKVNGHARHPDEPEFRDGAYRRTWTTRGGHAKTRAMLVKAGRVLDLVKGGWRPLADFDGLDGTWEFLSDLGKHAEGPEVIE